MPLFSRFQKAKLHKYLGGQVCVCGKRKLRMKALCPECWETAHVFPEFEVFGAACDNYCLAFGRLKERLLNEHTARS